MDPRAGLDECGISRPSLGFDSSTVQPVASHYTDLAVPVHGVFIMSVNLCCNISQSINAVFKIRCVLYKADRSLPHIAPTARTRSILRGR